MKVRKTLKYQYREFGSRGFEVELTHEELGLPDPKSAKEARDLVTEMSKQAEALLLIEEIKVGLVHPDQLSTKLKPWVVQPQTNPSN